jgi:integrase
MVLKSIHDFIKYLKLLKQKYLSVVYGCGLRCMEARSVRLQDLDFNRNDIKSPDFKGFILE